MTTENPEQELHELRMQLLTSYGETEIALGQVAALRAALGPCVRWLKSVAETQGIGFECLEAAELVLADTALAAEFHDAKVRGGK